MFVQHSVHIGSPILAVSLALAKGSDEWFPHLEDPTLAAVGPRVAGIGIRKKVAVEFGEPVAAGSWTEVPISWKATSIHKLFPVMTGKIELAPVDGRNTRLTVSGMYEAPLGRLGKHLDDALMHTVAEGTVKDLAESIAERLDALIRSATWSSP
ncbi:MAG TPA: hypothetical protein VIO80_04150 [Candidatus Dormibacteraeota bacterium]